MLFRILGKENEEVFILNQRTNNYFGDRKSGYKVRDDLFPCWILFSRSLDKIA